MPRFASSVVRQLRSAALSLFLVGLSFGLGALLTGCDSGTGPVGTIKADKESVAKDMMNPLGNPEEPASNKGPQVKGTGGKPFMGDQP